MVTLTIIVRLPFKIHLHPTALRPSSSSSKVYTLFLYMDPLSDFMALSHLSESGPTITSPQLVGSLLSSNMTSKTGLRTTLK